MSTLFIILKITTVSGDVGGSSSAQQFLEQDPIGIGMAVIAMSVVFMSLLLLFATVTALSSFLNRERKLKNSRFSDSSNSQNNSEPISGEVNAAIALAISMYRAQLHDIESFKLTINKVSRVYSPWSSKYYNMTQMPNKKSR